MPAKKINMCLTPGSDIVVVVTIRDRAANNQEQNLRHWMKDPPDIPWLIDCRKVLKKHREA
jgi:hypothetical protein